MIDDYHLQNLTTSSLISRFTGSGALPGLAPYRNTRTPNHNIINKSDNGPRLSAILKRRANFLPECRFFRIEMSAKNCWGSCSNAEINLAAQTRIVVIVISDP
jgi:hypothetical protein